MTGFVVEQTTHPAVLDEDVPVEAVVIDSAETMFAVRDEAEWAENAFAVLTYPTADPVGFLNYDNPKGFGGVQVRVGDTILKGPGGDFDVINGGAR